MELRFETLKKLNQLEKGKTEGKNRKKKIEIRLWNCLIKSTSIMNQNGGCNDSKSQEQRE